MTLKQRAVQLLAEKALLRFDEPVQLASGKMSDTFVDVKAGLASAEDLKLVCAALLEQLDEAQIAYDAVGGPTMGADHLAVGMALGGNKSWFFVRKEPKGRGTGKQIEGASIGADSKVVVIEDAVSTGGSMIKAIDVIQALGAEIVAVTTPIDRGTQAAITLNDRGLPYFPLATYQDLALDPV